MNRRLRSIVFWIHLGMGVVAGAVILVMSVTGTLIAFERQIVAWADRGYRVTPSDGAARLPVETLLARVLETGPEPAPTALSLESDPAAPAAVSLGRARTLYVDPHTGRILGESSPRARAFFRRVTDLHRWLGAGEEKRATARAVTGAANLGFLFLVVSGFYLWWPRTWTWRQMRNVVWFRRGLAGRARDFNWHNTIGLWACLPLFFIVATGVVLSYGWANDLLFRMVGEEPPARREEGRGGAGPGPGGQGGQEGDLALDGLDALWAQAERQLPGWTSINLRLSGAEEPVSFTIYQGSRARPDLRAQLTLERTGEVAKWEPYGSQSRGRKLRAWSRWVHTGEAGGWVGQILATLVSAGAAVLVWTGIALAWRRLLKRSRQASPAERERMAA